MVALFRFTISCLTDENQDCACADDERQGLPRLPYMRPSRPGVHDIERFMQGRQLHDQ